MYSSNNSEDGITLKIFKLYKYHAEQINYFKKIKLVNSTSLTCRIFLE